MKRGRPRPATTITAEQRQQLEDWTRRRTTAQALARRASQLVQPNSDFPRAWCASELHPVQRPRPHILALVGLIY